MSGSRSPCRFAPSSARFVCSLCSVCPAGAVVPPIRVPTGGPRGVFPGPGASGGSSGGGAPDGYRRSSGGDPSSRCSRLVLPGAFGGPGPCPRPVARPRVPGPVGPGAPPVSLGDHLSGPSAVPFLAAGPRAMFSRGCVTGRGPEAPPECVPRSSGLPAGGRRGSGVRFCGRPVPTKGAGAAVPGPVRPGIRPSRAFQEPSSLSPSLPAACPFVRLPSGLPARSAPGPGVRSSGRSGPPAPYGGPRRSGPGRVSEKYCSRASRPRRPTRRAGGRSRSSSGPPPSGPGPHVRGG